MRQQRVQRRRPKRAVRRNQPDAAPTSERRRAARSPDADRVLARIDQVLSAQPRR